MIHKAVTAPINVLSEHYGALVDRYFEAQEYNLRIQRTRAALVESGFDCLMVTDENNFFYYTGYGGFIQRARPRFVFIPAIGTPVVLVGVNIASTIREISAIPDVRAYSSVGAAPLPDLLAILHELVGPSGRIGAEMGLEQRLGMSVLDFMNLQAAVPNYRWGDAAELLWSLRMVKTPAEVSAMRKANQVATEGIPRGFSALRRGMTEIEVSDVFVHSLRAAGAHAAQAAVVSGVGDYSRTAVRPRPRSIALGDMVWVDVGLHVGGYWCDVSRAATVGTSSPEQTRLQRTIHEATAAMIDAVRPGLTASELAGICDREMASRHLSSNSGVNRYGHGMGVDVEPPYIAEYDNTVLEPGMVITVEPEVITDYGRFNVEENVLIVPDGHEVLTHIQWELREI
jgi:Xaa-Pro dipeptidase